MNLLSRTCLYGIWAASLVASSDRDEKYVPIGQISAELGISTSFLTKILQTLTRNNIMVSHRGPNGGVSLARPASTITVMDVIRAMDPDNGLERCVLGLATCGGEITCPLHTAWAGARDQIRAMFEDTNLAGLGRQVKADGLRLDM